MRAWQADLFAFVITAATVGLHFALSDRLSGQPTLIIFTVPIMVSAYFGGMRAGLVATLVSCLGASNFLLPPFYSLSAASRVEGWQQFLLGLAGVVISALNEALHRTRRQMEAHEVEIKRISRIYAALSQVNQAIVWIPERDALFHKICKVLVDDGGFQMAWIAWQDPATQSIAPVATAGAADDFFRDLKIFADGPVATAFSEQRPCITNDVLADPASRAWHAQLERLGILAVAALPIREEGIVVGAIVVYSDVPHIFQEREIALLAEAAVDVSFALDNFAREAERNATAERLQRSEASLANAQHIARIGNWDTDLATGALSWSAEIYRIFGIDPAEFGASHEAFLAMVHPEDRARVEASIHTAVAGGPQPDLEHRIVRRDGTMRIVHERAVVTRDAAGRPVRLMGTVQDVTERALAEAKLRESEEAFSAAFRASPMAMVITTLESRYVEVNKAYCDLIGHPREEILGRTIMELGLLGQRAREEIVATIERAGGTHGGLELQLEHRDGTPRNVIAGVTEITLHGVRHRLSTALDVTEQRRADRALRESEVRYRRLFEMARDGIVILDAATGKVVDVNPHLLSILGVLPEQLLDKAMWELPFFKEVVADADSFAKLREKEYLRVPNLPLKTVSGVRVEVEFISSVYEVDHRQVFQCSVRDVTARRAAEQALRELNSTLEERVAERTAQLEVANRELAEHATAISHDLRVAEASDRLKSAFLATMSHELRTPLNSIIGFTGIVLRGKAGPLNEEQTKQLGMVRGSARHLLELINDVLDLSKIEAGQLGVRAEPFDLRTSIERVVASISPEAAKKALTLTATLPPELGEMISDRRRVEQILLNLVNNAIKFTDCGSVTLTVELLAAGARSSPAAGPRESVRFCVADTGIGIAAEDLDLLFQPFRQLDSGLARQNEGTGLGLAICRRLSTLLGGEISAISEPGRGSEFTVTLPLQIFP